MGGLKHGPKLYQLSRNATQRWHLQRTMVTQLVQNERIHTTYHKARALQHLAQKVVNYANQHNNGKPQAMIKLRGILTTSLAVKKMIEQIVPRMQGVNKSSTRVVAMPEKRRGDKAKMAYIEYIGNEVEKYEAALEKEKYDKGEKFEVSKFNQQILLEEKNFFMAKLEQQRQKQISDRLQFEDKLAQGLVSQKDVENLQKQNEYTLKFFERKVQMVEKDLWIENKNKYDLRRYFPCY